VTRRLSTVLIAVVAGISILAGSHRAIATTYLNIQTVGGQSGSTEPGEAITVTWKSPNLNGGSPVTFDVAAGEAKAVVTPTTGSPATFYTFCVDMSDFINPPTGNYAVTPLFTNSTNPSLYNGNEAAYLYNTYAAGGTNVTGISFKVGSTTYNLSANEEAAALQLALWDLTNGNNGGITIDSGADSNVLAGYSYFLNAATAGSNYLGQWLAEQNGDGQSFLYPSGGNVPNITTPEPASCTLALVGFGCVLGLRRFRRKSFV
jgi:PEP-CTERM motif